jgi:glutathione S-transferase
MYTVVGSLRTRTYRVLWMLEEIGQPYEYLGEKPRSEAVVRLNPSGKVPVLIDDGAAVTDSTAIMTYLADKHHELTYPAGTIERARQDALTFFLLDEFDACLWTASRHSFVLPEEMRLPAIKDSLKWEFERSTKFLADKLGPGPFLMGEQMTIADILAAHCLTWAVVAKFPITPQPLRDYLDRMRARPAFRRVAELGQ